MERFEFRVHEGAQKTFKFGNGKTLQASSYVEIPQTIGGERTWLGVHTLDTDDRYVPLLVGMRTLERLAAVIDFGSKTAQFNAVSEEPVPLQQCQRTGHLLLDLSSDWINPSYDEVYMERLQQPEFRHSLRHESFAVQPDESPACQPVEPQQPFQECQPAPVSVHFEDAHDSSETCPTLAATGLKHAEPVDFGTGPDHGVDSIDGGNDTFMQSASVGDRREEEQGEGQGSKDQDQEDRRGDLRLLTERRTSSHACPLWTWLPVGEEWMGNVDDMLPVHATPGIHPGIRGSRSVSIGRAVERGHQGAAGREGQRDQGEPGRAQDGQCGFGRRREEHAAPIHGDYQEPEGSFEEEGQGGKHPSCEDDNDYSEEGLKEEWCAGRRGVGGRGFGRVLVGGEPGLKTSDEVKVLMAETIQDTTTAFEECIAEFNDLGLSSTMGSVLFSPNVQRQLDLLEVCCPPALSAMVEKLGGTSARVTEKNMNLSTTQGLQQALSMVRSEKPRWLWVAFPCGATSAIQNLNELTDEAWQKSMMKKKKSRRLVRRGLQLLRAHVFENDGEFGWEWPRHNEAWKWKEVQDFLREVHAKKANLFRTHLDGCQVGVVNDKNEPVKKPWMIYTTSRGMAQALHLICPGDHVHGEERLRR